MRKAILKQVVVFMLGMALTGLYIPPLAADEDNPEQSGDVIDMVVGDIQSVAVNGLTRISVTSPDIADISDAKNDKILLLAKRAGETALFLWDANGERIITVRVVSQDLSTVKARLQRLLDEAGITGLTMDENHDIGKVVITGEVSKDNKGRMDYILESESDNVLNLVKEEKSEDLIQVDMQIIEISTSLEKDLGVLWGSSSTSSSSSSTSGSSTSGLITENENLPSTNGNGKIGDFFKVGSFARSGLQATVNAFVQEGKARLISKPRLVVMSGKQASFLVGGEIPTLTTTTNTTGSTLTQNTSYTQYGVNVTVTPTIREGKIDVLLDVDIRDIDAANSSANGTAFITRSASTNLFMDNKQTVILAGLIKYTDSEQLTEVPFLSQIPLLGSLFRNRQTPSADTNTEMVIILTPVVLTQKKFEQNQLVMPTPGERDSWKEIDGKYEHEPVVSTWSPVKASVEVVNTGEVLPAMAAYARMVQEKISRAISYPDGGELEGTVKLRLHILRDGSLDSEEVMESSGSDVLDQDAVQAARTAAPFDAFTTGMDQEDMIFTIPIVFNKLISGQQAPAEKVIASY